MISKIGWHCPFSYGAISNIKGITAVRMNDNKEANENIKINTICNSIRNISYWLNSGQLDGLVLANCCNLMNNYFETVKEKYTNVSITIMEVPRLVNDNSKNIILKEWKRIEDWVMANFMKDMQYSAEKRELKQCLLRPKEEIKELCYLDEEQWNTVRILTEKQQLEYLLLNIKCPRILTVGPGHIPKHNLNAIALNQNCTIKSYLSSLLKGEKKSESSEA